MAVLDKKDPRRKKTWCADEPLTDYASGYLHAEQCETEEDREKLEFEKRRLAKKLRKGPESGGDAVTGDSPDESD